MDRAIALLALLVVACGEPSAPPADPAVDGLVLIDAGREPRRIARYQLVMQAVAPLQLALDVDLKLGDRGGPLPTLVLDLDVNTDDLDADGTARTRTTIKAATTRDRAGAAIPTAQLASQVAALPGVAILASVTPDGRIVDARTELDRREVPVAAQGQLAQIQHNVEQLAMPLPAQPIGVGARWKVRRTIDVGGAQLVTMTTATVTAFDEHALAVALATEISGADQHAQRDGITVELKRITGSGTGTAVIDLTRMTMTGERTLRVAFDMVAHGQTSPLAMTTSMRVGPPTSGVPTGQLTR